ncbi:unnamed protein product [marine sediment metagenome]|uniref:Uncharacterized protein n=1 Tax=marine sediment metagenome TaxID=412755 RepID=X0S304_9ZZZZ
MKKMIFLLGIMFGAGINFLIGFVTDLIFLINFPNEGIVPNPWLLGCGIIACVGSVMICILLPEHDAFHAISEGGENE